ncbi:UDP-D-xylose:L-fucose alpha-1,3-D-xylosyltransferase MGP4-like isoform X2 [Patiria miniata]|uniref:Nucleotide-diphospho-sugar transferase domain-containing protein n=1 Tax=Patiria miniata TaxID=46514 RepID=A0A914BCE1_PATMI|nr:UDP-D-xylose:L-fucose alpha-1,3-D-xylosyltransferase MGP4-like isoform X2 [Patiria miniata]XP_038073687.1 UDP-D-xylose:L-fucose alpha-1,3-D-xylosyltransferase MGP4-like isoform X2 [Patiria miniata]XP_038073688.1 UDP-D-xylose:L-fucose alpha-1,3-D-xylosyltransferase MGP4-like isoform X2 [Patiria miniata]
MHSYRLPHQWPRNSPRKTAQALTSHSKKSELNHLCSSMSKLLSPRCFCRAALVVLFSVTFASVGLWLHFKTPIDMLHGMPQEDSNEELALRYETEFEEEEEGLTQDDQLGPNSLSVAPSFADEVRALAKALPKRKIVLTTANTGFLDFTQNMLLSIQRVGIHPEVVVICEDEATYKFLLKHRYGLHVLKPPNAIPEAAGVLNYGVPDYVTLVNNRPKYTYEFIKQGFEVFFVDSDTFWFRDPFPYFKGDQYDVAFMRDYRKVFNAGVGFYRPTNRTEYFLRLWSWVLETQPKIRHDQHVMNYILSSKISPDIKIRSLSFQVFPTCKILYDWDHEVCRNVTKKTALFHAAFVPDHDNKRKVFDICKIWLLN